MILKFNKQKIKLYTRYFGISKSVR